MASSTSAGGYSNTDELYSRQSHMDISVNMEANIKKHEYPCTLLNERTFRTLKIVHCRVLFGMPCEPIISHMDEQNTCSFH